MGNYVNMEGVEVIMTDQLESPSTSTSRIESGMEGMRVDPSIFDQATESLASHTDRPQRRPFDDLRDAGPPADPPSFPQHRMQRGRRADVCVSNPETIDVGRAKNVLFCVGDGAGEEAIYNVSRAYWPVPAKKTMKTIMGHVEICHVLSRKIRSKKDCYESDSDDSHDDDSFEDDEIMFDLTSDLVAIKVCYAQRMSRYRNRHAENPLTEVSAMQVIGKDHPNVAGCLEVLFDGANLNVVLPYYGGGDLFEQLTDPQHRVSQRDPGIPEAQARFWFRQLINGVAHLQSKGVSHRDISPENVMLDGSTLVIIDMGMCIQIPYSHTNGTTETTDRANGTDRRLIKPQGACGKNPYMSPEIFLNKDPFDGHAVDIWTLGTILFCMLTGNTSYQIPHPTDAQFYWMTEGLPNLLDQWGVVLSPEGQDLLKRILTVDPRERLTLEEIQNHPWMQNVDVALEIAPDWR
jgi:serine/threonine protein kinase